MSKATWEEEIEDKLNQILQEIKVTQDMIGNCMTDVKIPPKKPTRVQAPPKQVSKEEVPGELEPGKFLRLIGGSLLTDPVCKDVDTARGPTSICNFLLKTDEYGEIRVALWGDLALEAQGMLGAGYMVELSNMSIKKPFDGTQQISSTKNTKIHTEES